MITYNQSCSRPWAWFSWKRAFILLPLLAAAPLAAWAGNRVAPSGAHIHDDVVSGGGAAVGTATHVLWGAVGQSAVGGSAAPSGSLNHGWPTLDKVSPTVVVVTVHAALSVDVTFSEPMGAGVTNPAHYAVSGSGRGTLAANPDSVNPVDATTYRLTWLHPNEMLDGGDITLTVSNVEDLAGNEIGTPNSGTDIGGAVGVAPEAVCQNITVTLPDPIVNATDIEGGSTDNVAVVGWLIDGAPSKSFTHTHLGDNSVTLRVLDAAGNYDECSATVTVQKGTAQVMLSNLLRTYNGNPRYPTATTDPAGLTVNFTYTQSGVPVTPVNAGLYDVLAVVENANYQGSATGVLEITRASVTIALVDVVKVWDGTPAAALTPANFSPQGLVSGESIVVSQTQGLFDSSDIGANIPVSANVDGFISPGAGTDLANYNLPAIATGLGTITDKIVPIVSWPTATPIIFGEALDQSTLEGGSATDPDTGDPVTGDFAFLDDSVVPAAAGIYNAQVVFSPNDDARYQSRQTQVSVPVQKATAFVLLDNLTQFYDGSPKHATVTTNPAGLSVVLTYDGATAAPTNVGNYVVTGTIEDDNYAGSASDTLVIAKAIPSITTLPTASDIVFGQPLSASTLSGGAASVSGMFTFTNPDLMPEGGLTVQSVTFSPENTANYDVAIFDVSVAVLPRVTAVGSTQVLAGFGETATFTVQVAGAVGALDYQWYRDTADKALLPLAGANAPMLNLPDLTEADAGAYQCEVLDISTGLIGWSPVFTLTLGTGLPATSLFGLALASALTALAGATAARKRK